MDLKCSNSALGQDVDALILDYFMDDAIKALLREHTRDHTTQRDFSADGPLILVNRFLETFKVNHKNADLPPETHFRLQLLKFLTLFCRRSDRDDTTPKADRMKRLRKENSRRVNIWQSLRRRDPSDSQLWKQMLLPDQQLETTSGPKPSVALLDLLPMFMQLSAAMAGDREPTTGWMQLASRFMLQAALEQILVFGKDTRWVLEHVFAWGYIHRVSEDDDANVFDDEHLEVVETNDVFKRADENEEIAEWAEIRNFTIKKTVLLVVGDSSAAVDTLTKAKSPGDFEAELISYMRALARSVTPSVLVQLENGRLDGLSMAETNALKQRVGLKSMSTGNGTR